MTSVPCGVWDILMNKTCLTIPHGRETGFPGWIARSKEHGVVVPHERRATKQVAWKAASLRVSTLVARLANALRPCNAAPA
jgi:hypothetical protein